MTEITTLTGNRTVGDTLSTVTDSNGNAVADGPVFVITANYWTDNSDAVTIAAGQSEIDIAFRDGGSVLNAFGTGDAITANSAIRLTVNVGSSLVSGSSAINMSANVLTLVNFGLVQATGTAPTISSAGNGSRIDNHGEISCTGTGNAYSTSAGAGTLLNNYGTVRTAFATANAVDLGNLDDTVNNYGTIFGETAVYSGTDTIFNSGTMRGAVAIQGSPSGGNKTITNTGFIGTTVVNNDAISLGAGSDSIFNFGSIQGFVHLGGGADTYRTLGGATTSGEVFGEAGEDTLVGNELADVLNGGDDNDFLTGREGNDSLVGGAGSDNMFGGFGDDFFLVDGQGDTINEAAGQGSDGVGTIVNYSLGAGAEVERLTNNSGGGLTLTGNAFAQTIVGHVTASDTLAGGGGADVLEGQGGNDTYNLGAFAASIVDSGGTSDLVTSTITRSLASFASIERLTLLGSGNGTGNGLANIITGSASANILDGGLGADTLIGAAGNDILIGNLGKDTSTGGAGNDIFRFALKSHSVVGANADVITDFDDAGNDRIDVSALFGPAMTYRHNLAFTAAGQVRINDIAGADVLVEVNTVGAGGADFAIRLTGTTLASMTAGDFFL